LTGILTSIAEWIKYLSQNLSYHEGYDFDGYVFNYNRPKVIMNNHRIAKPHKSVIENEWLVAVGMALMKSVNYNLILNRIWVTFIYEIRRVFSPFVSLRKPK
jgi:hypothetical protein